MATIADVARLAGVSVSTAARVLSGNGYADQALTCNSASGGSKSNNAAVNFPVVTTAAWPTILGIEVWDSGLTRRAWHRALTAGEQRTPQVGDQYVIASGALSFSLD